MTIVAFDTLAYSNELIDAGLDEKIAQAHAKTQVEILKNMLSKDDVEGRLATIQDLFALEQRLMRHIDTATSDRQVIRGEMRKGFAENLADHQTIRDEMRKGFAENLADHQTIRDEMRQGFSAAAADRQAIRDEMRKGFAEINERFAGVDLRFAQMETRFKAMELRLVGVLGSSVATGVGVLAVLIKMFH